MCRYFYEKVTLHELKLEVQPEITYLKLEYKSNEFEKVEAPLVWWSPEEKNEKSASTFDLHANSYASVPVVSFYVNFTIAVLYVNSNTSKGGQKPHRLLKIFSNENHRIE